VSACSPGQWFVSSDPFSDMLEKHSDASIVDSHRSDIWVVDNVVALRWLLCSVALDDRGATTYSCSLFFRRVAGSRHHLNF